VYIKVTYNDERQMPSSQPATTIRLTDADRGILDKLRRMTGLSSSTAIIRLAIREALASREAVRSRKR
jgi:hypothetical protein